MLGVSAFGVIYENFGKFVNLTKKGCQMYGHGGIKTDYFRAPTLMFYLQMTIQDTAQ